MTKEEMQFQIKSKKNEIISALLEALFNDEEKKQRYEFLIVERVHKSNILVIDSKNTPKIEYETIQDKIISDIGNEIYFFADEEKKKLNERLKKIAIVDNPFVNKLYDKYNKIFTSIDVSKKDLAVYLEMKNNDATSLIELIKELDRLITSEKNNREREKKKAIAKEKEICKKVKKITELYEIYDNNEFFALYDCLNALFTDTNRMTEQEKHNLRVFIKRANSQSLRSLSNKYLRKTKEFLDTVVTGAMKNFYENTQYKINEKSLTDYYIMLNDMAYRTTNAINFKGNKGIYCFYNSDKLFELCKNGQNAVIIHELLHSACINELVYHKELFSKKYVMLDEAFTEYYAKKAAGFLNNDILDESSNREYVCGYDVLLPILEILQESNSYDNLLEMYLNSEITDDTFSEAKLKQIDKVFSDVFYQKITQKEGINKVQRIMNIKHK